MLAANADFTKNPIAGARANAAKYGLKVVLETQDVKFGALGEWATPRVPTVQFRDIHS